MLRRVPFEQVWQDYIREMEKRPHPYGAWLRDVKEEIHQILKRLYGQGYELHRICFKLYIGATQFQANWERLAAQAKRRKREGALIEKTSLAHDPYVQSLLFRGLPKFSPYESCRWSLQNYFLGHGNHRPHDRETWILLDWAFGQKHELSSLVNRRRRMNQTSYLPRS